MFGSHAPRYFALTCDTISCKRRRRSPRATVCLECATIVIEDLVVSTAATQRTGASHEPGIATPSVGVVIPVRNSERTLGHCVASVLAQDYPDFQIYVIASPGDSSLDGIAGVADSRVTCIEWIRPAGWAGRDGSARREFGARAAIADGAEVIAFLDSQVEAAPDWLHVSIEALVRNEADGVAGVSRRRASDGSLASFYQDGSFFSEWPRFRDESWLIEETAARAAQLPITANLVVRREVLRPVVTEWPTECPYGWEDFHLDRALLSSGAALLCSDRSRVYRLHKPKFRLAKHVTAGMAAGDYYRRFPKDGFIRRRVFHAGVFSALVAGIAALAVVGLVIPSPLMLLTLLATLLAASVLLAGVNARLMRDWRGVTFPFLDALHIGCWVAGLGISLFGPEPVKVRANRFFNALR